MRLTRLTTLFVAAIAIAGCGSDKITSTSFPPLAGKASLMTPVDPTGVGFITEVENPALAEVRERVTRAVAVRVSNHRAMAVSSVCTGCIGRRFSPHEGSTIIFGKWHESFSQRGSRCPSNPGTPMRICPIVGALAFIGALRTERYPDCPMKGRTPRGWVVVSK